MSNKKADEKVLQTIGIDTAVKTHEYRNIKITNEFWNGWTISLIDDQKDLDGNLISENKKLILRLKNLLENGTKKIKISELLDLNIWNPAREIILGNLRLKNNSELFFPSDYFDIQIVDEKKNIDGLWKDNVISTKRILDVLHKFDLTSGQLAKMKELDLNKELELHFKGYFEKRKSKGYWTNRTLH